MAETLYNVPDEEVKRLISCYGFCAITEVTNGSQKGKRKQIYRDLEYIDSVAGEETEVYAGIAYIVRKNNPPCMKDVDFIINIDTVDDERLRSCLCRSLDFEDPFRNKRYQKELAERILRRKQEFPLRDFINKEMDQKCSAFLGMRESDYHVRMPILKGLLIELYVLSLYERMENCVNLHRHEFFLREGKGDYKRGWEADIISICEKPAFEGVLDYITAQENVIVKLNTE